MSRRRAILAAALAGASLLAAACGGGGDSGEAVETAPVDPAVLAAAEAAVAPAGLVALGVTAPDPADARLRAYEELGTPADVFRPRVSEAEATVTTPSVTVPTTTPTTVPATVTTPTTGTTTTPAEGGFTP
jgi:hypothetical protein